MKIRTSESREALTGHKGGKAGTFEIKCAVFCGFGHHKMKAKLIVQDKK